MATVSLLVVSESDIGSTVQGRALLARGGWDEDTAVDGGRVWRHRSNRVDLWWRNQPHLYSDYLDKQYEMETSRSLSEVLFLSRHVAASGRPSLTLHAIGIPGASPHGEVAEYGGRNGMTVPPSPRFASLFRRLDQIANRTGIIEEFEITLETTHHGPILDTPTLFIEIGSTEEHWGRQDAAEVWADVLAEEFGFEEELEVRGAKEIAFIGLGGGHYAPRHQAILRGTSAHCGHLLASYSLPFILPDQPDWDPLNGPLPEGSWKDAIDICLKQTQDVFPKSKIVAHLDRKSFKGWQRQSIRRHLEAKGIPLFRQADFLEFDKLKRELS